ncbi:secretin N-terminal domain-containing protein [Luteimonas terrae]|nr:secretin N-terminal domain-containing protein [Luteimonas terrae]
MSTARPFVASLLAGALAACSSIPPSQIPAPLRAPKADASAEEVLQGERDATRRRPLVEQQSPALPPRAVRQDTAADAPVPDMPGSRPVSLVLDNVPLPTFINVVFGMELDFAIQIDQAIAARQDVVSLRLTEPRSPQQAFTIAREVLHSYGVQVTELGGVLRFTPIAANAAGGLPRIMVTRSLPDVPAGQRTVFVAMPLEASQPGIVAGQLRGLFGDHAVTFTELVEANALMISGPGDAVRAAMEAVSALDASLLRGKRSIRINPLYLNADLLARELREVLSAQGVSIRTGPGTGGAVTFVPVNSANALVVFADSDDVLSMVAEWAERLDQPSDDGAGGGMFLYSARHTTVETLVPVLEALVGATGSTSGIQGGGGSGGQRGGNAAAQGAGEMTGSAAQGQQQAPRASVTSMSGLGGQLAVDPVRNVIVFQGDAQRWRAIQGVLARLDQPARQVVIEVTIAEVTLTDEFANGVEWALQNISINGVRGPLNLLQGATSGGGLVWQGVSSSGQVRALVNLFARDSRVAILSTPRILVKSGENASIDVGTEVPTVTSQATAPDLPGSGSSILQSIQYRKTGVLMDITAVVHSGQRVDLKISQEVSEASATDTSDISSPSIFSRKLQTSLSLADGESTLLGGLISNTRSAGKTKIPLLGDIPVLGAAFHSRRSENNRTELLMLITPYVVEDTAQTRAITEAIRSRFSGIPAEPAVLPREPEVRSLPSIPSPREVPLPVTPHAAPGQDVPLH